MDRRRLVALQAQRLPARFILAHERQHARSDDWVSDRHGRGGEAAHPVAPNLILDLATERA